MGSKKAIFLDRDGTIIEDVNHLVRIEQVRLLAGVPEAVRLLNESGLLVVVVTNQSVVARGLLTEGDLRHIHNYIDSLLLQSGAHIDGWYYCPHHPHGYVPEYAVSCGCRKPLPGLLMRAAEELSIELEESWLVGDTQADMMAAEAVKVRPLIIGQHVRSLYDAVDRIVGDCKPRLGPPKAGCR